LLASLGACVQVPEPLELELSFEDEGAAPHAVAAEPEAEGPSLAPAWPKPDYTAWPLSEDPRLAAIDQREVRRYPLWPTPISEPCPAVMFGSFDLQLEGGGMFERVRDRLVWVAEPGLRLSPTEIVLLRDHVDVPGLRLVAAASTPGACMKSWRHTHCFVSATDAYCPDGSAKDLERLVRAHGLRPRSLAAAGWLELSVVMSGAETLVVEPSLVRECTRVEGAEALAPAVEIEDARVTVRFTAIAEGDGVDYTVIVNDDGTVTMEALPRWQLPRDDESPFG
jgi:hypothetical protein